MFKTVKVMVYSSLCSILAILAYFNADINCLGIIYEPEIPESLKK
ncbi:cyclic lactone autoinducer peptide [Desulfotomaculum nigrificans]|nr:cyclic lactone autoinducer peptide [Desulfotomaculum nigrificans]